jgi:hypothetical protein
MARRGDDVIMARRGDNIIMARRGDGAFMTAAARTPHTLWPHQPAPAPLFGSFQPSKRHVRT